MSDTPKTPKHGVALILVASLSMLNACGNESTDSAANDTAANDEPKLSSVMADVKEAANDAAQQAKEKTDAALAGAAAKGAELSEKAEAMADDAMTKAKAMVADESMAAPKQHVVKAQVTNFDPVVLFIEPGDSVVWQNMAGHNAVSLDGMIPKGAEPFASKLGEEGFSVTFSEPGAYVYKCVPHVSTGMVGAIVVGSGEPQNMADVEAALGDVKIAKNMVNRAIRKMKAAVETR